MTRRARWLAASAAVAVLVACALAWLLWPEPADRAHDARPAPTVASTKTAPAVEPERGPCARPASRPFTPDRISIDSVVEGAAVIGVPRDSRGVTGVLPISNKADFAWDLGGIRPGSRRGNVLLNTHTWPDGSAVGNAMLAELHEGDRIVLVGDGARLCYEVTRRIEVLAAKGYPPYYREDGPAQVAVIVCSGTRDSAGDWSHRTIWFARPVLERTTG